MPRLHTRVSALLTAAALSATFLVAAVTPQARAEEGSNVALASAGATVTASGQEVAGRNGPELAVDGDASTRWSSNTSDSAWMQVKLARPTVVHHVTIQWEAACAARYKLQASADGVAWVDATAELTPTCGTSDTQAFTQGTTASTAYQYVRMQSIERTPIGGTKYGVSLYEFEVWDGPVPAPSSAGLSLVPLPVSVTQHDGDPFQLTPGVTIVARGEASAVGHQLRQAMTTPTGLALPVHEVDGGPTTDVIELVIDPTYEAISATNASEGYRLNVTAAKVTITAAAAHGLWNGTRTLLQLLPPLINETQRTLRTRWSIKPVTIEDAPRFGYRSIMADVARSFLTVDEVKSIIDTMSSYKMSHLRLHLADDQGWRIQITNDGKDPADPVDYSRLTSIGGKSAMLDHPNGSLRELGRVGFYTQDDYRELVRYAKERFVTIVPEIDVPGHTNALLHAIPQLNTANSLPAVTAYGTPVEHNDGRVGRSSLDVRSEQTWRSMRHIFGQVMDLTDGGIIHVGGDEVHSTSAADAAYFVEQMTKIVRDAGKTPMGWNEYAKGDKLQGGDIIQAWYMNNQGELDAVLNSVQRGSKVVVAEGYHSYLDMKYTAKTPIGLTWLAMGDLDKYYSWDPAAVKWPLATGTIPESAILGVEAPLWSESVRGGDQAEFLIFPRAISHAEVGWTPQAQRSLPDFLGRMSGQGARLLAAGQNFYDSPKVAWGTDLAGTDAFVPLRETRVEAAVLLAPGTKVSADGRSVAVDSVDDADGPGNSTLAEPLTATIDFGDGTAPVRATFVPTQERDALHAGGRYTVGAEHAYAAGSHTATVTFSDGRVASASVTAGSGYGLGVPEPTFNECVAPKATMEAPTVRDDARLFVDVEGLEWDGWATVTVDGAVQGRVRTDGEGKAFASVYLPYGMASGQHLLRFTDSTGRFAEKVVTVDSLVPAPSGRALAPVGVTASSVATNEAAPNGLAAAAIDGDRGTFWHSQWSSPVPPYPHTLTVDLGEVTDVHSLNWVPRQSSASGQVKDVEIRVSDTTAFAAGPAVTATLGAGETPTMIDVDAIGRYVQVKMTAPQNATQAFASVGELELRGLLPGESEPAPGSLTPDVYELPAGCVPVIAPIAAQNGTFGQPLSIQVNVTRGSEPYHFAVKGLPAPLTISPHGQIFGTPGTVGVYHPVVTVTDDAGQVATVTFRLTLAQAAPTESPTPTVRPTTTPPAGEFIRTVPYTLPGTHDFNGRQWMTTCEAYSQTERCRTDIWATVVRVDNGRFVRESGWAFNNLTYLPFMTRTAWKGNPLGQAGEFTSGARQWRTECDTPATGRGACRSYTMTTVYAAKPKATGGYAFSQSNQWVFNNIVMFKPGS
ncbi:hypothetical protein GCM10025789_25230 [Tessaracoccus lubricantis]|uniref:beta-N-acetylhexosaminidase n=1 Tax=Tessaracoccus lubricantis TaxID=545543 RepID=A0ABP9FJK6_9ACTN